MRLSKLLLIKQKRVKSQLSQKADTLKSSGEELKQTAQTAADDAIAEAQAAVVKWLGRCRRFGTINRSKCKR